MMKAILVLHLDKCMYCYGGKLGLVKCSGFLLFLFGNEWIISFSRVSQRREFIRSMSMVHNRKDVIKKLTKHLFFKHLYLICTLFYNTLSYSYVIHSTYVSYFRPCQTPDNNLVCQEKKCFGTGYREIRIKYPSNFG